MDYVTAYFWQQKARNASSLLLQQVKFKKGHSLVLACICEDARGGGAGEYVTGYLRDWFYDRVLLKRWKPTERNVERLGHELARVIGKAETDLGRTDFPISGILCIDRLFVVFGRKSEILSQNTSFGRANIKSILGSGESLSMQCGILQEKVGILLGTQGFLKSMERHLVRECLMVEEISCKKQAEKHLRELCTEAVNGDVKDVAAVFLLSV